MRRFRFPFSIPDQGQSVILVKGIDNDVYSGLVFSEGTAAPVVKCLNLRQLFDLSQTTPSRPVFLALSISMKNCWKLRLHYFMVMEGVILSKTVSIDSHLDLIISQLRGDGEIRLLGYTSDSIIVGLDYINKKDWVEEGKRYELPDDEQIETEEIDESEEDE